MCYYVLLCGRKERRTSNMLNIFFFKILYEIYFHFYYEHEAIILRSIQIFIVDITMVREKKNIIDYMTVKKRMIESFPLYFVHCKCLEKEKRKVRKMFVRITRNYRLYLLLFQDLHSCLRKV
jgi:hypothetical protein